MEQEMRFFGEEDFLPKMKSEVHTWLETSVENGTFTAPDGTKRNYYRAVPAEMKAQVVILHGFCEFWGKYHEYAYYLYRAGYGVYFMEQYGHGYSEGKLPEPDIVHVPDYDVYVEDFKAFLDTVVGAKDHGMKRVLLAHSMGGAVATLSLERYQEYFDGALLSSPMLKMKSNLSPAAIFAFRLYATLLGKKKTLAPSQSRFDGKPIFEESSTLSKARYDYLFDYRLQDPHYQTYGASIGWALASFKANGMLMKKADVIKIPVDLFTAGRDHLIDPLGYEEFVKRVPQTKVHAYEKSKHEIFNADDETRLQYFVDVFEALRQYTV